ncbi:MAG: hypothetical protein RL757_1264 [Bacteroidota bacterium]|jgi:alpha-amylase/alpha-mannosidase (GH57 family)
MAQKYICIHGHFYQPPRENAWLESIEQQESAAPFHDWNERINFECYATNASARILDDAQRIIKITNNYSRISFNFGPTLLSWLEQFDPQTYALVQQADRDSCAKFSGHGSAVAQVFNHIIMPLANERDRFTQIFWGLRDFEHRFGRKAEGMWLAETAVNTESLESLAAQGVKYTILAPRQAKAFRKIGASNWQNVVNENIDTRRPYVCKLPSGRTIALFFYDGGRSQAVAFERILNSGKAFANRLTSGFSDNDSPELVHIATDGESYGHHHRYGEMALADCLDNIEEKSFARLTNYGEFLEMHPPQYEVQIYENSSWSCAHGVERWRSDCGCNAGGGYGKWQQKWRAPLRNALNWLRDQLEPIFEEQMTKYVRDAWATRNNYIEVLLQRDETLIDQFIEKNAMRLLNKRERVHLFRLLEMQRNALLMFTSCGWFFDEISGLETNQIMQYACRAIDYARQVADIDLETEFLYRLDQAPSNVPEIKTGAGSYRKYVIPSRVNLLRVGMHYAASSLFEKYPQRLEFFNYVATSESFERVETQQNVLAIGRTSVRSKITHSEKHFSFAVLYLGQLNIVGDISLDMEGKVYHDLRERMIKSFKAGNVSDVLAGIHGFSGVHFSIEELFTEEKQKIVNNVTEKSLRNVENSLRRIYDDNYSLMSRLQMSQTMSVPAAYLEAVRYVLSADLKHFFEKESLEIVELQRILGEFQKWKLVITNQAAFELAAVERLFKEIEKIQKTVLSFDALKNLSEVLNVLKNMDVKLNLWKSQNLYMALLQQFENAQLSYPSIEWRKEFLNFGTLLEVKTQAVQNEMG